MKKDPSVELARLLACCIVIGVHVCLPHLINDYYYDFSRIYISSLVADGVAIFWLITGFFLFKNSSYKKIIKKACKTVIIPLLGFTLVGFYFSSWMFDGITFIKGLSHSKEEYLTVFKNLLAWKTPEPFGYHLWYLYVYFLLMLCFPLLYSFINYLESSSFTDGNNNRRGVYFCLISFGIFLVNDITLNNLALFSHLPFSAIIPASIYIFYGYFLYKHKTYFQKIRYIFICPLVYLASNLIRAKLQLHNYYITEPNTHILSWFTSLGVICSISLVIFCFALTNFIKNNKINSLICYIGSFTFGIYIIHTYVIAILNKWEISDKIFDKIFNISPNTLADVLYTLILIVLVFIISLSTCFIFRLLKNIFLNALSPIYSRNKTS